MKHQAINHTLQTSARRLLRPGWRLLTFCLLLILAFPGFQEANAQKKKKMNQRITLRRVDKIPYGTYVAFENLKYLFPDANILINKQSPGHYSSFANYNSYYSSDDEPAKKGKTLYVIISPYFAPDEKELGAIMEFIGNGNHVFISAINWGYGFLDSMKLDVYTNSYIYRQDSLWLTVNDPVNADSLPFTYPGKPDNSYFLEYDTTYASILGRDDKDRVNFIRHTYEGGGSLYIHVNPLAFTNFFLLHKKNNDYYNNAFSYIPKDIEQVQWDEYFRYGGANSRGGDGFNSLQVIMKNDGLRAAFWLALLIFLLIYLFESKRRQRIIPSIPPLRNASLDFVKTIGRLYYQYRDNKNLASKMTAHLMDHIRSRYNIPTSVMDEKFVKTLAYKSGYDMAALQKMLYHAKMMQDSPRVSDEYLMEFNKLTEAFYKHQ